MHRLLERQLRKCFSEGWPHGAEFSRFCEVIDAAYHAGDEDRELLHRAMDLASSELCERNRELEHELSAVRRLELELRQAEKLRAVGQLAAGVAHEINTPIQYVSDSLTFLAEALPQLVGAVEAARTVSSLEQLKATFARLEEEDDLEFVLGQVPKSLELTRDGVRRVAAIVAAMKDFGRPDGREKTGTSVNRCLETSLLVAQNELKHRADVQVELGDVGEVPGYPGELGQVMLNLLINAAHAVAARFESRGERGLIRVRTSREDDHVVVTIADNGSGIAPEHQQRIFEPFFTTKELGKGTGQGLAIARSIVVDKHQGSLTFSSTVGEGTTFCVRLPLHARIGPHEPTGAGAPLGQSAGSPM